MGMTRREFIDTFRTKRETMGKNGITPTDTKWVDVVKDYERMKAEEYKYAFIVAYLSGRYDCGETTIWRVTKCPFMPQTGRA